MHLLLHIAKHCSVYGCNLSGLVELDNNPSPTLTSKASAQAQIKYNLSPTGSVFTSFECVMPGCVGRFSLFFQACICFKA